jgi:hypothetical protein
MKKLLFLLISVFLLSGCTCVLSQVVPQKIYATATSCSAPLPDYWTKITASDNCEIANKTQTPAAGYMLTPTNKVTTVIMKATDASGNFKQVSFTVTLLDTIKPKLTIDPSLLAYQVEQINDIYTFADNLVLQKYYNLMQQSWIDSIPGLRLKLNEDQNRKLLVVTSELKPDGSRYRYVLPADSVGLFYK